MKPLGEHEVWFLTGSQDLYGEDVLSSVGADAGLPQDLSSSPDAVAGTLVP